MEKERKEGRKEGRKERKEGRNSSILIIFDSLDCQWHVSTWVPFFLEHFPFLSLVLWITDATHSRTNTGLRRKQTAKAPCLAHALFLFCLYLQYTLNNSWLAIVVHSSNLFSGICCWGSLRDLFVCGFGFWVLRGFDFWFWDLMAIMVVCSSKALGFSSLVATPMPKLQRAPGRTSRVSLVAGVARSEIETQVVLNPSIAKDSPKVVDTVEVSGLEKPVTAYCR